LGSGLKAQGVVLVLSLLFYATLFLAVLTSSMPPWALATLLTVGLVRTIVAICWHEYGGSARLPAARSKAFAVHFVTGIVIAVASWFTRS
jgi:hypothetical protein